MNRLVLALPIVIGMSVGAGAALAQPKVSNGTLTDDSGRTLYTFDKDAAGKSSCTGNCEKLWPPFTATSAATASGGSSATTSRDYTMIQREDGMKQWAYKGKPLYLFSKDQKPGDKSGDGFNNSWHVAKP